MIEYEIRFTLPEKVAELFDDTRRTQYLQKQVAEFLKELIANEVAFVAERGVNSINPTISRVEL